MSSADRVCNQAWDAYANLYARKQNSFSPLQWKMFLYEHFNSAFFFQPKGFGFPLHFHFLPSSVC